MDTSKFSQFRLRVNINAEINTIYKAWATTKGLESWFLRKAIFSDPNGNRRPGTDLIKKGDTYEWFWHGYPDSVVENGEILKANDENSLIFTFSLGCPVQITIHRELNESIVELVESDLPTDTDTLLNHFIGDSRGWVFYLTNLKSVLEGGLDLRNKREELKDVITA